MVASSKAEEFDQLRYWVLLGDCERAYPLMVAEGSVIELDKRAELLRLALKGGTCRTKDDRLKGYYPRDHFGIVSFLTEDQRYRPFLNVKVPPFELTPLHFAAACSDLAGVKAVVQGASISPKSFVNMGDKFGITPYGLALYRKQILGKTLLSMMVRGASPSMQGGRTKSIEAVVTSCIAGISEIVEYLLSIGANPKAANRFSQTLDVWAGSQSTAVAEEIDRVSKGGWGR